MILLWLKKEKKRELFYYFCKKFIISHEIITLFVIDKWNNYGNNLIIININEFNVF